MTTQNIMALRNALVKSDSQMAGMSIRCVEVTADRKYRERTVTFDDFRAEIIWALKTFKDPSWAGYVTEPTNCDNPHCPLYTGPEYTLTIKTHGRGDRTMWSWIDSELDRKAYETYCYDHSWLEHLEVK